MNPRSVVGLCMLVLLGAVISSSCTTRDCAEERSGQIRCVSNRVELCEEDGTLSYTSCTTQGLFCSAEKGGCVTEDVLNATGGGGGTGGTANTGGAPSTGPTGGAGPGPGSGGNGTGGVAGMGAGGSAGMGGSAGAGGT